MGLLSLLSIVYSFIQERNFSAALEILFSRSSSPKKELPPRSLEDLIVILSFWKNYEYKYPKNDLQALSLLWSQFDQFIVEHGLTTYDEEILYTVANTVMSDIYRLFPSNMSPETHMPFQDKILYIKSLIWTQQIKKAFYFLKELMVMHPFSADIMGLLARIYSSIDHKKSCFFYQETFFIDPSVLNLIDVNSYILQEVLFYYASHEKLSKNKTHFWHWVSIYGVLGQYFDHKEKYSEEDLEIMNKRITACEIRYAKTENPSESSTLNLLRLLVFQNSYYSKFENSTQENIILDKIQNLSPLIYQKLTCAGGLL